MMRVTMLFWAGLVLSSFVVGCGDQAATPAPTATTTASAKPAATSPAASATAASPDDEVGIVPEDHEEEAESQIDTANYKDELGKLEKEIDADK